MSKGAKINVFSLLSHKWPEHLQRSNWVNHPSAMTSTVKFLDVKLSPLSDMLNCSVIPDMSDFQDALL